MQSKEKKWLEIERILEEYIYEDLELAQKFEELKIHLTPEQKLTNVVMENENLKRDLAKVYREIDRMRANLTDPFSLFKRKSVNEHMPDKVDASQPDAVEVNAISLLWRETKNTPLVDKNEEELKDFRGSETVKINAVR